MLVLRTCRTSLALSMARIFPPGHHSRRLSLALAFCLVVMFTVCIVTLSVTCRTGNKLMFQGESCIRAAVMATSCALFSIWNSSYVSNFCVFEVDLSGDTFLTLFPLITFWRVRLPQTQRRLILVTFSASFTTLIASITFCVLLYGSILGDLKLGSGEALIITMVAHVEVCIPLALTIVTEFYQLLGRPRPPWLSATSSLLLHSFTVSFAEDKTQKQLKSRQKNLEKH